MLVALVLPGTEPADRPLDTRSGVTPRASSSSAGELQPLRATDETTAGDDTTATASGSPSTASGS
jgi:hypothetical protein